MNNEGYAEFSGTVSLENYGGFASVRNRLYASDLNDKTSCVILKEMVKIISFD